jgi:CRISPR/Cas system CSM-associated protein Csm3 (group 7 of RAMP superfamily)
MKMLRQAINELTIELEIKTESPLLVKEGRLTDDVRNSLAPTEQERKQYLPNAIPVSRSPDDVMRSAIRRSVEQHNILAGASAVSGLAFYIPGTSLRGPWRAYLERSLRSLDPPASPRVCDPFAEEERRADRSCSKTLEKLKDRELVYARSCPVCRLFGSTAQAGRLDISDAELAPGSHPKIAIRDMVAIKRSTGSVENKFQFFALTDARFTGKIRLRNFELVQVWLLAELIEAIPKIPIGSGKGKGFGLLGFAESSVEIRLTQFGADPPDDRFRGIAEHPVWGPDLCRDYELTPHGELARLDGDGWEQPAPWRFERKIEYAQFKQMASQVPLSWGEVRRLTDRLLGQGDADGNDVRQS